MTAITGGTGLFQHIPTMYVIVACAFTFGAMATGVLRASEYRDRQTPLNKLTIISVRAACDLSPAPLLLPVFRGNRRQRRAQQAGTEPPPPTPTTLSRSELVPGIKRTIDSMQLGVILRNTATFPISIILVEADTEIATFKPPRSKFPKPSSTVSAGAIFTVSDDKIDMNEIPAGRLPGKLLMHIKYGLPGKEIYDLPLRGDIDIVMEEYGLITQVTAAWFS